MRPGQQTTGWKAQAVLHPVFAVTGMAHVVGGAVMPSLAAAFHMTDSQAGTIFLLYFGGSALGAFLCRGSYSRSLSIGFVFMALCGAGVALASRQILPVAFLLFGVSVGMPMSAVSLWVGRNVRENRAASLTLLNFTWSCGALLSPLLAGRILEHHSYQAVYWAIAFVALGSSIVCFLTMRDGRERELVNGNQKASSAWLLIALFALAAFLQVGIENTSAAWLTTFVMRASGSGLVMAAYASSLYWVGFLASRAASSWLLIKADMKLVRRAAILSALVFAVLFIATPSTSVRAVAMFFLGASLAPIYPLVLAGFFARARFTGDSRWILATAGFGGSVLPWFAGWLSSQTTSLRIGMLVIPAALLLQVALLPAMAKPEKEAATS